MKIDSNNRGVMYPHLSSTFVFLTDKSYNFRSTTCGCSDDEQIIDPIKLGIKKQPVQIWNYWYLVEVVDEQNCIYYIFQWYKYRGIKNKFSVIKSLTHLTWFDVERILKAEMGANDIC